MTKPLAFEQPILDLEKKLACMKAAHAKGDMHLAQPIQVLTASLQQLQKETFQNLTRWQRVQLARHEDRPYTLDYINQLTDQFVLLHGDRTMAEDPAIVGGLGTIQQQTFMLIGHQKGRNIKERQHRNFGMANPAGYRKALRLMRLAEKFNIPIVTFIDTPGAYPGLEAEQQGQASAIAHNLQAMFGLRVPMMCFIIGEGASGGALGLAIGDQVWMLENTWYSVISPESCASILWRTREYKEQAAEILQLTAQDMLHHQLIDGILQEPLGGAHRHPMDMAQQLQAKIMTLLQPLQKLSPEARIAQRLQKFTAMGSFHIKTPLKQPHDV